MATVRYGSSSLPRVKPHLQAFADEVERRFGITSFGTYAGHGSAKPPRSDLALDVFASKEQGDRLAAWVTQPEVIKRYGIWWIAWWQRKWNRSKGSWAAMEDRGSNTANHRDHVHFDFDETAPAASGEEDDMYGPTERDEVVGRLDKLQGGLDEVFKKVAFLEGQAGIKDGDVDVDKLATALSERLGEDVAKALGKKLSA